MGVMRALSNALAIGIAAAAAAAGSVSAQAGGGPCGPAGADASHRVLVLGAGVAGATVARALAAANVSDVVLFEAGTDVGGRLKRESLGGLPVEVGASWMQGYKDENSFSDYVASTGLRGVDTDSESIVIVRPDGSTVPNEVTNPLWAQFATALAGAYALVDILPATKEVDVASSLLAAGGWEALTPVAVAIERILFDFEYAVPASQSSVRGLSPIYAPGAAETEDYFVTDPRGFAHVVRRLLADAGINQTRVSSDRLRLATTITEVAYSDAGVCVTTADGRRTAADYAVSTFSVGVLQASLLTGPARPDGAITLTPPPPPAKRLAIAHMKLSDYVKVFARWDTPVFNASDPLFLLPTSCDGDRWISVHNLNHADNLLPGSNVLLLTVSASYGRTLTCQSDRVIAASVARIVSAVAGRAVPLPGHVVVGRWNADPAFRGAFSTVPPGFTDADFDKLNEPLGRLHFAGEAHARDGSNGYVQGAWNSGLRTAAAVVAAMKAEGK